MPQFEYQQSQFNNFLNPPPNLPPPMNAQTCKCKIMIGLEHAPADFNLRVRIIGDGGTNLNYIRAETGANVSLRGIGSMFIDPAVGTESPEPMHLFIEHPTVQGLQDAKQLAKNLIETLQEELNLFQDNKQNFQIMPHGQIAQPPQIQQITPLVSRTQHIAQQPPNIIQQPAFIQQSVPIQPNSIIVQQPHMTANFNNPPPQIRQPPPVVTQLKIPQANHFVNLSQPPPNLQIQHTNQQPILINQGSPFQLQYIHPNGQIQTTSLQNPGQITVQHLIQPQVMQTTLPQQFERNGQIFTLQAQPVNQNFIIHQPVLNQLPVQQEIPQMVPNPHNHGPMMNHIPTEDKKPFDTDNRPKNQDQNKPEDNKHGIPGINSIQLNQPPPMMSMPPPPNIQQHVIGNQLITTSQPIISQSFPQIYGQIPVTIQPQHQIHVINPQQQHIPVPNTIQNIQFGQALRNPNEIIIGNSNHTIISQPNVMDHRQQQMANQQIITAPMFNPQMQPPNVQLTTQPPPPPPQVENGAPGQNFNATVTTTYTMQEQKHGQKRKMQDDGSYSPSMQCEIPPKYGLYDNRKGPTEKTNDMSGHLVKMGMGLNQMSEQRSAVDTKTSYSRMVSTTSTTSVSYNTADELPEDYNQVHRIIKTDDKDGGPHQYIRNANSGAGNYRIGQHQFGGQNPNIRPNMYPNPNMGPQRDYSSAQ